MFSDLDRSHRSVIAIISTLLFLAFSIIIIICLESSVCSGPEERDQCTMENTLRTIELQSNLGKYLPQCSGDTWTIKSIDTMQLL